MKNTFRRLIALLLVLTLSFVLVCMTGCGKDEEDAKDPANDGPTVNAEAGRGDFIESIGGVSETFKGAVSEETFESKTDAVEAYVSNEVVGTAKNAVIESTVSKGELNDTEISALNLPSEFANPDSVEKLEVTYSETDYYSAVAASNKTKTTIVYIIKIGPDYRYFTPCPVNGETITKSYYESVYDDAKYANCTYVNESYVKVEQTAYDQTVTYEATMVQEIKHADGKVYFKQVITGDQELVSKLGGNKYLECYMETDEDGNIDTWVKTSEGGSWTTGYLTTSVEPFAGQKDLDYSYFSKADFGFALKGENAIKFYKGHTNSQIPEDAKLALYAEYYVNDGIVSGMRMEYSCDMTVTQYGVEIKSITNGLNKMTCVNYGTTVVEKPF